MVRIYNEPVLFNYDQVEKICKHYDAQYVVDTEQNDIHCAVFYGSKAHQDSGSRYFAMYVTPMTQQLMITNGAFVEEQKIAGIVADNGDIIFSRYRHDYRTSDDGSVFIDGGRAYTRCSVVSADRRVQLNVHNGTLEVWFDA